jgi:tight adherence protein B
MPQILAPLIYVFAFVAAVLVVQVFSHVIFSSRDQAQQVNRRLSMLASGLQHTDVYSRLVRRPLGSITSDSWIARYYERFVNYCRQANLEMSPTQLIFVYAGACAGVWFLSLLVLRNENFTGLVISGSVTLIISCGLCALGLGVWLRRRRLKRLRLLEEQMPMALDVINRAIRAGHPVVSAVQLSGQEMGDPIGSEFGLVVDETTYGNEFRDALTNFARRSGSQDAHFFAVSIGIQSETGGNLAEILEGLAAVIRSRATLAKRVRALSSEGRASAMLLSVLPAFLIGVLALSRPDFYTTKFADPIFWPSVGIVGVIYLVGLVMIHRIINFKY